jgi:hypothetical protein
VNLAVVLDLFSRRVVQGGTDRPLAAA